MPRISRMLSHQDILREFNELQQLPGVFTLQLSACLVKLSFMLEIEKLGGFGNHTC
jgi:hypothetical protein